MLRNYLEIKLIKHDFTERHNKLKYIKIIDNIFVKI